MTKKITIFSSEELQIRNNGLIEITNILENLNIKYYLTDGTLLGAVREKDFIPWDWDVEITVLSESIFPKTAELIESAKQNGFKISSVDQSITNFKLNLLKNKNKYSLNGLFLEGEYRIRNAYIYPKRFFTIENKINFRGKEYPTVSNIEEYLIYQYGDWKTPSKSPFDKKSYLTKSVRRDSDILSKIKYVIEKLKFLTRNKLSQILKRYGIDRSERELNFSFMYLSALKEGSSVLEVGSSDCSEIISVMSNINCPENINISIIEPSESNINNCKIATKRNLSDTSKIRFVNGCISDSNDEQEFYISQSRPNLNSLIKNPIHDSSIKIRSYTLESFCKENGLSSPLLVKMDTEGYEVKILNSSIKFLKELEEVFLLLEIHPLMYSPENSFYETLSSLFELKFEPLYVESAGKPIPNEFRKEGYKPFKVQNNRGLYKNISRNFLLSFATKNTQDYIDESNLSLKQIRSILLHKKN